MALQVLAPYRRAQHGFDAVMAAVPPHRWDAPSACALWTARDVAGHVIWGQEQLRHWATGQGDARRRADPVARLPGTGGLATGGRLNHP
jgi:Mycothiol maleylpyruvate isomerase N-terminal domain